MIEQNKKLQTLEESLWLEKTRFDLAYMDSVLDVTFFLFRISYPLWGLTP